MYYRLCDGYALRGWEKLTGTIIKRPNNDIKALNNEQFKLLLLCNGEIDFSELSSSLSNKQIETLNRWNNAGIIEKTEKPRPINKDGVYKLYNNRFFNSFFWSITGHCNYRCRHCYMDAPNAQLGELSHESAIKLIHKMDNCGALHIDITGGEPFVRKDFWELVDTILSLKIHIGQIYTNGELLTESTMNEFLKRNIRPQICISFDGIGWHDWMRGIKNAEGKALNAFKLCKNYGFPSSATFCAHKGNLASLPETVKVLSTFDVSEISVGHIVQTPLWKKNSEGNDLSFPEFADAMIDYIPQFFKDGMPCNIDIKGIIQLYKGSSQYNISADHPICENQINECHLCGAIRSSCYISPEGRVVPCMPMTESDKQCIFPKFQDRGLQNILKDSNYLSFVDKKVSDLILENEECSKCNYVLSCRGGCRAIALHNTGNFMGKDPNVCFLWKNGYINKIKETANKAIKEYCEVLNN